MLSWEPSATVIGRIFAHDSCMTVQLRHVQPLLCLMGSHVMYPELTACMQHVWRNLQVHFSLWSTMWWASSQTIYQPTGERHSRRTSVFVRPKQMHLWQASPQALVRSLPVLQTDKSTVFRKRNRLNIYFGFYSQSSTKCKELGNAYLDKYLRDCPSTMWWSI